MNVVFLCSRYLYECKVDRHRVLLAEAIDRLPNYRVTVTGHGWPGYDSDETVTQNLRRKKLPCDILWVYQQPNDHLHQGAFGVDAIRTLLIYDAYDIAKRRAEIAAVNPQVICHTHVNDADRLANISDAKVAHVPFGVDKPTFYRESYGERPIDCLLVGQTHAEFYPLRARWQRLVKSGAIPGEIRQMPSYRLKPDECATQYADWAEHMRRAKIILTGSSRWKYPLQVYYAAAMSGALVCGDMPDDSVYRDSLGVHQLVVDPMAPDETLAAVVRQMLRSPKELRRRSEAARSIAVHQYTSDQMAERFMEACGR